MCVILHSVGDHEAPVNSGLYENLVLQTGQQFYSVISQFVSLANIHVEYCCPFSFQWPCVCVLCV